MASLYDRVKMTTATTGTGTITLGSAVTAYRSFATAGVSNLEVVAYAIEDGTNWEVGTGTYTVSGTTLSRSVTFSSNANSAITLSGTAFVFITARAADIFNAAAVLALANGGTGQTAAPAALNAVSGVTSSSFGRTLLTVSQGQIPGTTTNDDATAGNVGEYAAAGSPLATGSTVTMTIASPCIVTWSAIPYFGSSTTGTNWTAPILFTTSGALPTGVTSGTQYWVIGNTVSGNNFQIATTVANALAGTAITTTGSQSGTHTGKGTIALTTAVASTVGAILLTAGDWDLDGITSFFPANTTSVTAFVGNYSTVVNTLDTTPGRVSAPPMATKVFDGTAAVHILIPNCRFSLSTATTIFLNCFSTFTVSTSVGYGLIRARRVR